MPNEYIIKKNKEIFIVISNKEYYVTLKPEISCSCLDYKYRRERIGEFCKHIQAVLERLNDDK